MSNYEQNENFQKKKKWTKDTNKPLIHTQKIQKQEMNI